MANILFVPFYRRSSSKTSSDDKDETLQTEQETFNRKDETLQTEQETFNDNDETLQTEQLQETFNGECSTSSGFVVDPIPTAQLTTELPDDLHLPIDADDCSIDQYEDDEFTDHDDAANTKLVDSLSRWFMLFIISWMQAFKISERAVACLLSFLGAFLSILTKSVPLLSQTNLANRVLHILANQAEV